MTFTRSDALERFDIQEINPHYGNPFFPSSGSNCASCAAAVYKRMNGIDPRAKATLRTDGTLGSVSLEIGVAYRPCGWDDIANHLKAKGAGSSMVVAITRYGGVGHAFNVAYDGQEVFVVDGQTNEIHDFPYDYQDVSGIYGFFD